VPVSDNTPNKAPRITGCDTGPGGDHCAHAFRSTASIPFNEEVALDGDEVEAQRAHRTEKKRGRRRDEVVLRQLGKGDKSKIAARTTVRPIGPNAFNAALILIA
jgi:hypothetical protein